MRGLICLLVLVSMAACTQKQSDNQQQTKTTLDSANPAVSTHTEMAVAPEVNPPGDIPDTQAFVKFQSAAGGFQLEVPEGWARTENGPAATFADKFNGVRVSVAPALAAPTVASARSAEVRAIETSDHAVTITGVSEVTLPTGRAVVIRYTSNSDANAVTNNRVRLENEAILFFHNGKEATLTLSAPQGADNVDQWNRMSKSFRWL